MEHRTAWRDGALYATQVTACLLLANQYVGAGAVVAFVKMPSTYVTGGGGNLHMH